MNEALQNLSSGGLVIHDGFAAIPAWGWDSTQATILGIPVHAYVNSAMPVIPAGGQIKPSLYLTFANGWVLNLTALFSGLEVMADPFIIGSAHIGEANVIFNPPAIVPINRNLADLAALEAAIIEVASLPVRKWDDLIATYIDTNPYRPGIADAIIREHGVSVWALVGAITLAGATAEEVVENYEVPREAVDAALAYYQRYRPVIDARIAANNVGAA